MPPTVIYIGNFKAPWCTEVHLARELEGLGCRVHRWQEPDDPRQHRRFLADLGMFCGAAANEVDLVMFTRTWGLPEETTNLWRTLEALGIATCSYHLDLYVGLKRGDRIEGDPFWTTQHVFTPDGDPKSAEFFAGRGINHHWSPPAVVSDECEPGTFREEFNYDVVFVGSYGYHSEWPWRPQLIDYLAERYGPNFSRFGGDLSGGPIRGQRLNDLYASAKVVVGDSLHLPDHTHYWTDRYFETIGRGGFLIAPYVEGIDEFLTPGLHVAYYDHPSKDISTDDALRMVGESVDWWLNHPDERRIIQHDGQAHVREHHTYRHRLAKALETMGFEIPLPMGALVLSSDWNPEGGMSLKIEGDTANLLRFDEPFDGYEIEPGPSVDLGLNPDGTFRVLHQHIDRLELGSGYHPTAGFTHLDLNPNCPDVDIVGEAWPLNLPDASVGELRAVDVLEHLSYWDTPTILADWFRVLEPGGKLYVQVPDAEKIMNWFALHPEMLVERLPKGLPRTPLAGAAWRLLGGQGDGVYVKGDDDWRFNAHYAFFSTASLHDALMRVGFRSICIDHNEHPNLLCTAVKP